MYRCIYGRFRKLFSLLFCNRAATKETNCYLSLLGIQQQTEAGNNLFPWGLGSTLLGVFNSGNGLIVIIVLGGLELVILVLVNIVLVNKITSISNSSIVIIV